MGIAWWGNWEPPGTYRTEEDAGREDLWPETAEEENLEADFIAPRIAEDCNPDRSTGLDR